MENIIRKEELDELLNVKGEVRGVSLKTQSDFVLEKDGRESYERLKTVLKELGFSLDEMKPMNFYPLGWERVMLIVIKRLFNYDDEKFVEMGRSEAKVSFIIRLFMKFFVSIDRVVKEIPAMWREYYTVGDLTVSEINKEKRYILLRLKEFPLHPIQFSNLKGYFPSVLQMVVGKKTKCEIKKGDDFTEFLLSW